MPSSLLTTCWGSAGVKSRVKNINPLTTDLCLEERRGEGGAPTADKLAHFRYLSTGDGDRGGERGGGLQNRRLRGDDNWRLSDGSYRRLGGEGTQNRVRCDL